MVRWRKEERTGEVKRMGMIEGDAGADGGVEKVAGDEDEDAVGPSGVGVVGGDGGLQLWGRVPEGDLPRHL